MKRLIGILLCVVSALIAVGEVVPRQLSGAVIDETTGKNIKGAIISLLSPSGERKEWTMTGTDGLFSLKNVNKTDSVSVKMMGYQGLIFGADSLLSCEVVIVPLMPVAYSLKEVTVRAQPITTKGDTLVYNVASFKTAGDRYLGDVLNRMPGIEMSSTGGIKFQDKNINKFYIQGRDMLGVRYGIASRNLDVDAVAAVEIIPDNQHVKALNGKVTANQPGVNIRLKNGFLVKPFGEAEIGGGVPSIYSGRIFTTLITKSVQALISVNGGNDGQNRLADISDATAAVTSLLPGYTGGWLSGDIAMSPPVSRQNYIFERAYAATANLLVPISAVTDIKLNLSYGGSRSTISNSFSNSYIVGSDNRLTINRTNNSLSHLSRMKLSATVEHNSPKRYFKDVVSYFHDKTSIASLTSNNGTPVNSRLSYSPWYVTNDFTTHLTHGGHVFTIASTLRGGNSRESLDAAYDYVTDIQNKFKSIDENMSRRFFTTDNSVKTDFQLTRDVRFALTAGAGFTHRLISAVTSGDFPTDGNVGLNPDWSTPLNRLNVSVTPSTFLSFFDSRLKLSLRLPLQLKTMSTMRGNESNTSRLFFAPYANAIYTFNTMWEARGLYNRTFDYADEKSMLFEPFITSVRSVYIPSRQPFHSIDNKGEVQVNYRNIFTLVYMTMKMRYTSTKSNYAPTSHYTDQWTYISAKSAPNASSRFEIDCNFSKTIGANLFKTAVTPYFSTTSTDFYQNEIYMRTRSNTYSLSLSADVNRRGIIGLKYDVQGRVSRSRSHGYSPSTSYGLAQELKINLYPVSRLILTVKPQHNVIQTAPSTFKNYCFLFAGASYLWKKWNFILKGEDLLNNTSYRVETISAASASVTEIPLRGRTVTLTAKFRF